MTYEDNLPSILLAIKASVQFHTITTFSSKEIKVADNKQVKYNITHQAQTYDDSVLLFICLVWCSGVLSGWSM